MLTNSMFWRAIDNLAAAHNISCSRLAQISGMDITALNKSKRIGSDGKEHWMSVGSLVKIMNATNTSWTEFARYFPPERVRA
ncbi:MAG TPA: helix-turn-helix transcriptional regulator [Candidatus Enterousia intestinigallinarum]|uniref:Helix-turn-helix transcriptional regulator n=1 Tax=Candidatus Enterousia intestinigallinarum TaxID=2840790 RepID=A0A9D1FFA5_9PROT|nr:helix-turn-helix transcriptional regulator [Candidatus Enterousia intestinigallinarum]